MTVPRFVIREEYLRLLEENQGIDAVIAWNQWRLEHPAIKPDLCDVDLSGKDLGGMEDVGGHEEDPGAEELRGIDFAGVNLIGAKFNKSILKGANFSGARLDETDFTHANLTNAYFATSFIGGTDLSNADLSDAVLTGANLSGCKLERAKLKNTHFELTILDRAILRDADLSGAKISGSYFSDTNWASATLAGARISGSNFENADFTDADLSGATFEEVDLTKAMLVRTNVDQTIFNNCRVFGLSSWDTKGCPRSAEDLIITPKQENEEPVRIDNLECAQLLYVILGNRNIGRVLDGIISTVILILGRFGRRKPVLDAIHEALREKGFVPVVFDFEAPRERNLTETITLLARLSRFIIADLTEPASIPQELQAIIPNVEVVVQPIIEGKERPYSMSKDFVTRYRSQFLKLYRYDGLKTLIEKLDAMVITPAENRRKAIAKERAKAEREWD